MKGRTGDGEKRRDGVKGVLTQRRKGAKVKTVKTEIKKLRKSDDQNVGKDERSKTEAQKLKER